MFNRTEILILVLVALLLLLAWIEGVLVINTEHLQKLCSDLVSGFIGVIGGVIIERMQKGNSTI